jgi:GT2 family glycosyltransferase
MTIPVLAVPTLTRADLLLRMLASIDTPVERLLVIDNGSQQLAQLPVPNVQQTNVADLGFNLGVAASWNLAIKSAYQHDYVMIASDDVIFPSGALDAFAAASGEDRIVLSATWPHWCAFSIGMRIVQQVGLFDERFYPAYFEDTDYLARLDVAGIDPVEGPSVLHDNSSTLATPDRASQFATMNRWSFSENRLLYEAKVALEDQQQVTFDPYRWRGQSWM